MTSDEGLSRGEIEVMEDSSTAHRVAVAVKGHDRRRVQWETEIAIRAVMSDPEVRRLAVEIGQEETRLGLELRPRFQVFQDRHDQAVREWDHDALSRICSGKHGRWGRICVLVAGHDVTEVHWGTAQGQPVAWVGSAPDDD